MVLQWVLQRRAICHLIVVQPFQDMPVLEAGLPIDALEAVVMHVNNVSIIACLISKIVQFS